MKAVMQWVQRTWLLVVVLGLSSCGMESLQQTEDQKEKDTQEQTTELPWLKQGLSATEEPGPACQAYASCLDACAPQCEPPLPEENSCSGDVLYALLSCLESISLDDRGAIEGCLLGFAECSGWDLKCIAESLFCSNGCTQYYQPCLDEQEQQEQEQEQEQQEQEDKCAAQAEACTDKCPFNDEMYNLTNGCGDKEKEEIASCILSIVTDPQTLNVDSMMACYAYVKDCTSVSEEDYRSYWECALDCQDQLEECEQP